jgi:hypothetical protein
MSRESRIVFGFFDEILRARPLIVEPRQKRDPTAEGNGFAPAYCLITLSAGESCDGV